MDNNNIPSGNNMPSVDSQMPDLPSVDDISVAEMPEVSTIAETASEAVEQAAEAVPEAVGQAAEAVPEAAEQAAEAVPEAVGQAAETDIPAVEVPVVQEYPEAEGQPQYTSYVPAGSSESPAPDVYTAPVTPAPAVPTPVYGSAEQSQLRPVPVYVPGSTTTSGHGKAVASLVLGIFGLLFSPCCCLGFIPGIIGICLGASARSDGNREGLSTAGIVLSIIALILSVGLTFSCGALMNTAGDTMQSMPEFTEFYNEMYDEMYGVIRAFFM